MSAQRSSFYVHFSPRTAVARVSTVRTLTSLSSHLLHLLFALLCFAFVHPTPLSTTTAFADDGSRHIKRILAVQLQL
jgi:hypothetical protein